MGRIISVVNQKGGVGKTTTSVNLAAALGVLEHKTLLIDLDPQANATTTLGIDIHQLQNSSYHCLEHLLEATECIRESSSPNVDIMPAHIDLAAAELELVTQIDRELMLKKSIYTLKDKYDYILIDCPPSLGLLTINSLTASDSVIVPVQCEYLALEGLGQLLQTLKSIQSAYNKDLTIEGLLLTMYDSRLKIAGEIVNEVQTHFEDMVFKTIIQRNVKLSEAPSFGQSILAHDANSKGAINYLNLAEELISKYKLSSS